MVVFFLNYLNHHQVAVTDELYNCLKEDFVCVCTLPNKTSELKGGEDFSARSYCINATESSNNFLKAISYAPPLANQ